MIGFSCALSPNSLGFSCRRPSHSRNIRLSDPGFTLIFIHLDPAAWRDRVDPEFRWNRRCHFFPVQLALEWTPRQQHKSPCTILFVSLAERGTRLQSVVCINHTSSTFPTVNAKLHYLIVSTLIGMTSKFVLATAWFTNIAMWISHFEGPSAHLEVFAFGQTHGHVVSAMQIHTRPHKQYWDLTSQDIPRASWLQISKICSHASRRYFQTTSPSKKSKSVSWRVSCVKMTEGFHHPAANWEKWFQCQLQLLSKFKPPQSVTAFFRLLAKGCFQATDPEHTQNPRFK